MLNRVVNEKKKALQLQAERNTTRTMDDTIVAARDNVWREKVLVYVEMAALKRFIAQDDMVYTQLPCIRATYFDFERETNGLYPLKIEVDKLLPTDYYYTVELPVYRHRDLAMLKAVLKEGEQHAK